MATKTEKAPQKADFAAMQEKIAAVLNISTLDISIKATTTEKMGFVGREEGVIAYATILLQKQVS